MIGRFERCALMVAALVLAAAAAAPAEDWPGTKPIRFEVVAAAGGLTDIVPRQLADHLAASTGTAIVVENRPGAGGNIAAGIVAKAEPDGHTILVTGSNQAVNPTLLPNPGFDYQRDLVPVSMVAAAKLLLVAAPAFPGKSIADIVAMAKQKPKAVSIAISAIGTPNHLAAELLAQYGDIDLTFVPYDGIAKAIPDVMANRVDLAIGAISTLLPQVRAGTLKGIAVASSQRAPQAPGIPTSSESGLAALQLDAWICFMGTGGTPAPIIARLDQDTFEALATPQVREGFTREGVEVFHMGPAELGNFLQSEAARYASLLAHSRIKASSQ